MTRPAKWDWLHRDAEGKGLLVGPNCPDCLRRETVTYCCTGCSTVWKVSGIFHWSWQGKAHWHEADDTEWWANTICKHVEQHGFGQAMIVPESMLERWRTE